MIRVAGERVNDLFALAASESPRGPTGYSDRYVRLARKVGMRYNVRLLPEYRELYCRGCSTFWVEGRTVRTRLRSGRRVRTCLVCGRQRRVQLRGPTTRDGGEVGSPGSALRDNLALAEAPAGIDDEEESGDDDG
ncbi:MAG: hypothetical protein L3K00_08770 [Thermoplasmata archaeon]|nr:hypothetical protein [Thermoplasmata archaeon]